jgi:protein involved in polysaccharide export with SLBB domain
VEASSSGSVYVTGEVQSPGTQEWHGNLTLAMALAVSHVNQKTAGIKSVFLIRASDPGKFSAYKLDASLPVGKSRDLQIMPCDVLFVPRKFIVKADDFMEQYVRQLLPATPNAAADVLFTPGNPVVASSTTTTQ